MLFKLIVDEKVKVWRRTYIDVEAESLEDAIEMIKEEGCECAVENSIFDTDYLWETKEFIEEKEPGGTLEIMDRQFNILYNNGNETSTS